MRIEVPAAALALALAAPSAGAPPSDADRVPVFGSRVGVVVLDLVVRDHRGNLVLDLRPDEVEVFENGVRQEVAEFRVLPALGSGPANAGVPPIATARAGGRPAPRPPRIGVVSLVFDQLSVEGRRLAGESAARFLDAQSDAGLYVAVFRIDGRLRLVQGFTRDRVALKRSIATATLGSSPAFSSAVSAIGASLDGSRNAGDPLVKGYDPRELRPAHHAGDPEAGTPMDGDGPLAAERGMADAMVNVLRTAEEMERTQRGHWSLDGLASLVHGQRTFPGRKTVVYFSEGLQVPPGLEDPLRSLVSEANRANVSIYGVDVRGLLPAGNNVAARELLDQVVAISASQRLSGGNWHGVTREQAREFDAVEATLRMNAQATIEDLAKSTGGFLLAESNDLERGFRRLGEDMRDYYEVAYTSTDDRQDGRFRRVAVKVRRSGARVQTREGYFAVPHEASRPILGYEAPLLMALAARRPPRDFDHQAAVFRFDTELARVRLGLAVAAPLSGVSFAEDRPAGRFAGRVSILALVKDADGDVVARLGRDYLLEGPLAELSATRARRVTFSQGLALSPGAYAVETAVHDGFGGRIGCRRTSFVVPPPHRAGVQIGSLVVLAGASPADAASTDADDPFRAGDVRLTPRLETPVRVDANEAGLALFYVVHAVAPTDELPTATLEVGRGGRVEKRGSIALPAADSRGRIAHVASFPTHGLAAGTYTLRVSVRQGGSSAAEEVLVEVPPRRAQSRAEARARPAGR
jgi:VWFA-related protein